MPPAAPFKGVGIYALYYQGDFPSYASISSPGCETPIYVGKASAPGSRSGLGGLRAHDGRELHNRLRGHAASIDAATNLGLDDFMYRYLIELGYPEFAARLGQARVPASRVAVPEAPMHPDRLAPTRERHIRAAGSVRVLESVAVPEIRE